MRADCGRRDGQTRPCDPEDAGRSWGRLILRLIALRVISFYTGNRHEGKKRTVEILGHKFDRGWCLLAAFEWNWVNEIQAL